VKRIIARLDVKGENVIKGIHLEGLKIVGKPEDLSKKYVKQNADEIFFQDSVATLYGRNNLTNIVEKVASEINIPLTVGGGLKSILDIEKVLIAGADKVAINTQFIEDKNFVSKTVKRFGSQAIVGSIEAKFISGDWKAFTDNGRNISKYKVLEWIKILEQEGVGEIFLTSVDFEGTQKGFDSNLIEKVNAIINTPLIISGGAGSTNDISKCFKFEKVSGVALASVLHYNQLNIDQIRHTTTKDKRNNFAKSINIKKNKNDVAILKTKICNFKSLYNSLKKVCDVKVLEKDNIKNISRLILPGVGSFPEFINELGPEKIEIIKKFNLTKRPMLGICLGAQVMFSEGYEHKKTKGLNLIDGEVINIKEITKNKKMITPHIGWTKIEIKEHKIFEGIDNFSRMYFTHSFNFKPEDKKIIFAQSRIQGSLINSVCIKENLIAAQFHPEKSGLSGLKFLFNFSTIN